MNNLILVIWLVFVFGGIWCADYLLRVSHSKDEPPMAPYGIPIIGHTIYLLRKTTYYFAEASAQTASSIFTLTLGPFMKLYIVNNKDLITQIQRVAKTVSFTPFQKVAATNFSRLNKKSLELYDEGGDYPGKGTFVKGLDKILHKHLLPGPESSLDYLNMHTAVEITKLVDELDGGGTSASGVPLIKWLRHVYTYASMIAVYGPHSPMAQPDAEEAFWDFEEKAPLIVVGIPPRLFFPKAYRAMQLLDQRYLEYQQKNHMKEASPMEQELYKHRHGAGLPPSENAKLEWPIAVAILANTIPTAFWTIYDICSHPELLAELRTEIASIVKREPVPDAESKTARVKFTLDVAKLRTDCKLLVSSYQETQRFRSKASTIRRVLDDTVLDQRHLLKKGNYVQVPTVLVHKSKDVFGPNADKFDPYRFYRVDGMKFPANCHLPWGFAPFMCPARQFATAEILILVAQLLLRFDVVPIGGSWPTLENDPLVISTLPRPKGDVNVRFVTRPEWQGEWNVDVGSSMTKFQLVAG